MSDTPETAVEETVEETPATTQEETPAGAEEDLGALKRALEHEREERRQAKEELRRIREDEDARAELLKEWNYTVVDDEADTSEEDLEFEDDDQGQPEVRDPRVDDLLAREERNAIRKDLEAINTDSDWELDDHDRAVIEAWARQDKKGFDRDALERAHVKYVERLESIASKGVERAKKPKPKPPHVTRGGKAATETPGWNDMTWEQQAEEMARRVQANTAQ